MNAYWIYYPRDFGNEYTLFVTDASETVPEAWERTTRRFWLHKLANANQYAKQQGGRSYAGRASTGAYTRGAAEAIADCKIATAEALMEALDSFASVNA